MRAAYYGSKDVYPRLIDDLLDTTPGMIAIDTETISLKDRTIVGIGVAMSPTDSMYFPLLPEPSPYLNKLSQWLKNKNIIKLAHNALYDWDVLDQDSRFTGMLDAPVIDTMIMAQLAGYPSKLTDVAVECGTESQDMKVMLGKLKSTLELPEDVLAKKCCLDVQATYVVYHHLKDKIDMDYVKEEMRLIPIIIRMQRRGLKIDHNVRAELGAKAQAEAAYYKELCRIEGFNPGSYKQVGYMLAKRGHHQVIKRKRGKTTYQTGEEIISELNDPLVGWILKYRHASKEYSTYIKPLEGLDRAYTHFSFETTTRRLASANLNMQNVPKYLRKMFKGPLGGFDYSQQELRVLAYVSGDKKMQEIFDSGEDIHAATASEMYSVPIDQVSKELRFKGKTANFSMIYGSEDVELKPLRVKWFAAFPQAADWITEIQEFAVENRKVPTICGAWLYIREKENLGEKEQIAAIRRKGVDYVCQGSAAELTKKAMVRCYEHRNDIPMVLQIHDELLFEGDVRDELSRLGLDHVGPFSTPIDLKIMEYWE